MFSALFWAVAAVLFARLGEYFSARTLNIGKGIVASICLAVLVLPGNVIDLERQAFWYLMLSGLLGITIGDTLYFLTLQRLGAKLTLLVGTLIPVVSAIAAIFLFNEQISVLATLGLFLTIFGVSYVLWQRAEDSQKDKMWLSGLIVAMIYVLAESGGILLTKMGLGYYDSLEATFIRQVWGVVGLTFWGLAAGNMLSGFRPLINRPKLAALFVVTSFIGAFLGTWLSILALDLTYTAVAVSLNSTSPLFVLPISYWFLKEKLTKSSVIGATIAVLGIVVYFSSLPS